MQHLRQRHFRWVSSVVLVGLLLVPIAFSGHRHAGEVAKTSSCAACVVVHHLPAVSAPAVGHAAPAFVALQLHGSLAAALGIDARPIALGRAPPRFSASLPA